MAGVLQPVKAWVRRVARLIVGYEPGKDFTDLQALVNTMARLQDQRMLQLETRLARLEEQLERQQSARSQA
ncbi:MAG TPA: hypothetical protein VF678_01855 [bacterium]